MPGTSRSVSLACAPWLVSTLLASGCLQTSSRAEEPEARAPAPPPPEGHVLLPEAARSFLTLAPVEPQAGAVTLSAPARVALKESALARVGAPVAGRVVEVRVSVGEVVRAGDPLLTLRSPDAAAARAALTASTAELRAARLAAERAARMLEQGVGTERERDESEARLAELEAEVARARTVLGFVGRGRGADVVLRAPIGGAVLTRAVTVGAAVEPGGDPLVEIGDPSACWVEAEVFEQDLGLVRPGSGAKVALPIGEAELTGTVVSVSPVVRDPARTAKVRIALDAIPAGVRPGMYGRARIEVSDLGLTLPTEAVLIRDGRGYVVYVAAGEGAFERRSVAIGANVDGRVQVLAGLRPGEQVVVRGALLVDGAADALL
jgi:cobalt-zinc-cadmium efflux system membrane fusion protein